MPSLATTPLAKSVGTFAEEPVINNNVMDIAVHTSEGQIIPISLTTQKCKSTSWGTLCKEVVEKSLITHDSTLMLQILFKLSPREQLFSQSTIFRVAWSSSSSSSAIKLPGYAEANMILKPRGETLHHDLVKPHLLVKPLRMANVPAASVDMDLSINLISTIQQPLPYDEDRVTVVYLREHKDMPGCMSSFKAVAGNGRNNILSESPAATGVISNTVQHEQLGYHVLFEGKERETSSKATTASTDAKSSNTDDNVAKKPSPEDGEGGIAVTSTSTQLNPPKKPDVGMIRDMIRLYSEAKADKSSSNVDSHSINMKSNEGLLPSEEEKSVEKTPPIKGANLNSDTATASTKKREVPTDIEPSDASKSPSKKKLKSSNVQESVPPLKVSLDVEEKHSGSKEDTSTKKKRPCFRCEGCLRMSCGKCTTCTSTPQKRCEKRPCTHPIMMTRAKYEAWKLYAAMAKNGHTPLKQTVATSESVKCGPLLNQYDNIPSVPVEELPDGWTEKLIPRSSGNKFDKRWFSPGGIRFKSKTTAKCFIEIFGTEKDETRAYEIYKQLEKKKKKEQQNKRITKPKSSWM
eukprot:CAMPEP_0113435774 /NCGR_PEP_ID=MMETSP0013_2-20120614/36462_1 /TAXON_ID=2843 ORGANISM="Skeletonema costatum, Strain 1716" /NCGR_SAMPLE_ID=MMETSP0013_2 /ASSEMBLY_ACC=CAM_ASM_000158 /LENGTH=575 /DNA_ID=CAMNT_0000326185 /DNA_START=46 /DNA_END=1770 /DNA_ORIENTATION=- /assembly_acc=CAM_ASM_000158